jgi:hypothetical protein
MVEVSGSTPLTQRLVGVASPDVWAVTEACTPEQVDGLVSKTVATVLRELAAAESEYGCFHPMRLRALADSIERGE